MQSPALPYMWHFIHQFLQMEDLSYKQNECVCVILLLLDTLRAKHSRTHTIYQSPDGEEGIFLASPKYPLFLLLSLLLVTANTA